jgi:hypothetical protein
MMRLCIVILRRMPFLSPPAVSFLVWKALALKTVSGYDESEIFSLIPWALMHLEVAFTFAISTGG